jgi:hypothetical protein
MYRLVEYSWNNKKYIEIELKYKRHTASFNSDIYSFRTEYN